MADIIPWPRRKRHPYVSDWPAGDYAGDGKAPTFAPPDPGPALVDRIDQLLDEVGLRELTFEDHVFELLFGLGELLVSKQRDYGPDAINLSPGGPLMGINVRLHDKLSRARNLTELRPTRPEHESLVDTYRDIANYAVIAAMVLEGTWPSSR